LRRYKLTVRSGARVRRARFGELGEALDALERRGRELESGAGLARVGGRLLRRIDPVQQVVARLELSGPRSLRGGVDIRGDGSVEGFTGRTRRRLVEQRGGESAYDALRRTLRETT
jgi:hypothetical protein